MARPIKNGLDYFPMDVDTDDKFELIEAKHGIVGFGIVIKLFQRIYKSGYYLEWTEERLLILKKSINVDINTINDIINDCLRYNIFDEKLYNTYKILTSSGIQKRYLQACDRRKSIELEKKYIIVDINAVNAHINWINDDSNTQSKEKESKVNNSKVKEYKKALLSEIEISDFPELNQEHIDIAKAFQVLIRKNIIDFGGSPKFIDATKGDAVDIIRLLIESDKFNIDDIRSVYFFLRDEVPRGQFSWKKNIQSIKTLREKFNKLLIDSNNARNIKNNSSNAKEGTSWEQLAEIIYKHCGSAV